MRSSLHANENALLVLEGWCVRVAGKGIEFRLFSSEAEEALQNSKNLFEDAATRTKKGMCKACF
jgi:hypothetical protein